MQPEGCVHLLDESIDLRQSQLSSSKHRKRNSEGAKIGNNSTRRVTKSSAKEAQPGDQVQIEFPNTTRATGNLPTIERETIEAACKCYSKERAY